MLYKRPSSSNRPSVGHQQQYGLQVLPSGPCHSGCVSIATIITFHIFHTRTADDVVKKPKLFFVSTSATTSTLQTASICYISSKTALGTCAGRKRRAISLDGVDMDGKLQPSQANQEVMAADSTDKRDGRFLLYWITTTSISTSTSFTTTLTLSSVQCTPSGVTLCG